MHARRELTKGFRNVSQTEDITAWTAS